MLLVVMLSLLGTEPGMHYNRPNIPRIGRVVGFRRGTFFCFISMIHSVGE